MEETSTMCLLAWRQMQAEMVQTGFDVEMKAVVRSYKQRKYIKLSW